MKYLISILFIMMSHYALGETYIVKFAKPLSDNQIKKISGKLIPFTKSKTSALKGTYTYKTKGSLEQAALKLKKLNPLYVEDVIQIETMAIRPTLGHTYQVNDPYINYLWGLEFTGQEVLNEINDLQNIILKGSDKSDISTGDLAVLEAMMQKEVVVAVIDTGIDLKHPDLKDNIFTNDVECIRGEIPYEPEQSNDDNEYKGDCKGWDFTGRKEEGSNNPDDFVGHGTHLAGIISAVRNNEVGVAGLSNKIKILPVKVLTNQAESQQALGTSDRLARGITYATEMKVDVINLSLGWPLSFDKKHLQDAIQGALDAGIVVIAAAGNNDHSEPIMPCAYEGVLCVGASDPDLKMSDFSNFGAHVDVLAPGNNILSTYPTVNVPGFFDVNGYEIKSGTSQAAPYVSAVAAMLRGIYPKESADAIKNRIIKTSDIPYIQGKKFASGGIVNLENAVKMSGPFVKPLFKGFGRVKVNLKEKNTFSFKLEFLNEEIGRQVKLTLLSSDALKLDSSQFILTGNSIEVSGRVKDLEANLAQRFELTVEVNKSKKTYVFEKRFYVDFEDVSNAEHVEITGGNPKALTELSSLYYHHMPFDTPIFYSSISQNTGIVISLYEQKGTKYLNTGNTLLNDAESLLSLHRLDANGDGKPNYLARYLVAEKDPDGGEDIKKIVYSYFNEQLRPLFRKRVEVDGKKITKDYSHLTLDFENVILKDLNQFTLMPMPYGEFGNILIPVFLEYKEELPQADRNPNPFARLRKRIFSSRIYYFEPKIEDDKGVLTTRTMNTNAFSDAFKKLINFRANEQVFTISFEKQSFDDLKNGKFKLLLSHESERKFSKNYMLEVTSLSPVTWTIKNLETNITMSNFLTGKALDLRSDSLFDKEVESVIVGFEKMSRLNWEEFSVSKSDSISEVSITQNDVNDTLEYPIKTYLTDKNTFRFFQTPSKIFAQVNSEQEQKYLSFPTHISSFLSGALFREQHFPIIFKGREGNQPALFVDATQIASRNIYIVKANEDKLTAPIKYNLNIPETCRALNPSLKDGDHYRYTLYCVAGRNKVKFIFIPLTDE